MSMTPDIKKRIDARCERQKYKDSDGKEGKLGLYIRVGTSTLYDWKPTYKSALKEIAYMTVDGDGMLGRSRNHLVFFAGNRECAATLTRKVATICNFSAHW